MMLELVLQSSLLKNSQNNFLNRIKFCAVHYVSLTYGSLHLELRYNLPAQDINTAVNFTLVLIQTFNHIDWR